MVTRINFRIASPTKPAVLVATLVNGKGSYEFALDIGAAITVLWPDLANSLGIKVGWRLIIPIAFLPWSRAFSSISCDGFMYKLRRRH